MLPRCPCLELLQGLGPGWHGMEAAPERGDLHPLGTAEASAAERVPDLQEHGQCQRAHPLHGNHSTYASSHNLSIQART